MRVECLFFSFFINLLHKSTLTLYSGYTLIVSRISTYSCTIVQSISRDREPITIHFSFIFDSARNLMRNLLYRPPWHFVKIPIASRWEKWLVRRFTKCHLYTSRFSRFTNIFSCSCQFDDKCIAGLGKHLNEKQFQFLGEFDDNFWKIYRTVREFHVFTNF